jgi:hypothetical protein
MENQTNKPDAFGFAGKELAKVVLGNLGLKCNRLSMFSSAGVVVASTSEDAVKAVSFPQFQRAAGILANPLIRLSAAKGGSTLAVEPFTVFGIPASSGMEFAVVLRPGDASLVLYFASIEAFLVWWTDLFACQANTPVINTLVPALPVEEFTFILHVLDSFRRIHIESMLLYHPLKESRISVDNFMASFEVALNSGDVRWLMPALFSLTPGLKGTLLDLHPEIIDTAEALHFISRTKNPDNGADELRYLDPGLALGYEFATSWIFGLGLSVEILTVDGIIVLFREFLAPTAFSNHLFSVEKGKAGLDMFTHFAQTLDEYRQHMTALLKEAGGKASEPVAVPSPANLALVGSRAASADIFALSIGLENQRFSLSDQMRLGREADNDLALPDQKVSLHHALIQRQGYVYKITDLNSDSGTYVNGKRITGPTLLKNGDIVLIGDTQLTISDHP